MSKVIGALMLAALAVAALPAQAQQFPAGGKAITIVNPYPPGGLGDILARSVARKLSESLGTPVIVDNKPGANGGIGISVVARAQPDGYTLGIVPMSTLAINPLVYKNLPYNPKDLTPIMQAVTFANVLVINPDVPAANLREFVAYVKKKPGELNYASQGNGSSGHLEGALLDLMMKADMTHVPYTGSAPAMQDLISGKVQMMFETMPAAMPLVRSGRVRALGVASTTAAAQAPDIPPISSVLPGFEAVNWIAFIAPPNLPPDLVAKLNEHMVRAMRSPELTQLAEERILTVVASKPEDLARIIAADTKKWSEVVREAKVHND